MNGRKSAIARVAAVFGLLLGWFLVGLSLDGNETAQKVYVIASAVIWLLSMFFALAMRDRRC